jgi:hypothetical protein
MQSNVADEQIGCARINALVRTRPSKKCVRQREGQTEPDWFSKVLLARSVSRSWSRATSWPVVRKGGGREAKLLVLQAHRLMASQPGEWVENEVAGGGNEDDDRPRATANQNAIDRDQGLKIWSHTLVRFGACCRVRARVN